MKKAEKDAKTLLLTERLVVRRAESEAADREHAMLKELQRSAWERKDVAWDAVRSLESDLLVHAAIAVEPEPVTMGLCAAAPEPERFTNRSVPPGPPNPPVPPGPRPVG